MSKDHWLCLNVDPYPSPHHHNQLLSVVGPFSGSNLP